MQPTSYRLRSPSPQTLASSGDDLNITAFSSQEEETISAREQKTIEELLIHSTFVKALESPNHKPIPDDIDAKLDPKIYSLVMYLANKAVALYRKVQSKESKVHACNETIRSIARALLAPQAQMLSNAQPHQYISNILSIQVAVEKYLEIIAELPGEVINEVFVSLGKGPKGHAECLRLIPENYTTDLREFFKFIDTEVPLFMQDTILMGISIELSKSQINPTEN